MCKGIPFTAKISALAGMELGMARSAGQRFTYSYRGSKAEIIMRPGKGKISRRGYFSLLTSSFYQYNWPSSPPSLISQANIPKSWELWRWRHPQAWIFSFNPLNGWMDNLRFYVVVFFSFFFYIIPVISGRWEEDNIKLCAMEPLLDLYMYFMHQVKRR